MVDRVVKPHERGASLGFHNRKFRLVAGKGADRIHRVPECKHQKFDLFRSVAPTVPI